MFKSIISLFMSMAIAFAMVVDCSAFDSAEDQSDLSKESDEYFFIEAPSLGGVCDPQYKDLYEKLEPVLEVLPTPLPPSIPVIAPVGPKTGFADAADIHENCRDAVKIVNDKGIMVGDGKNFNPEAIVTRAQMAKVLCLTFNNASTSPTADVTSENTFSDVSDTAWYAPYVTIGATAGWFQGYNGEFCPDAELTIPAACKMILVALGYDAESYGFTGSNWSVNVLAVANHVGLLEGLETDFNGPAARQWVAKMIAKI